MPKNLKLWKKEESRVVYFTSGKGLGPWQTFTREMRRLKALLVSVNTFKSKEVLIQVQLLSRNNIVLCVTLFQKYHNTLCFPSQEFCISIVFNFSWDNCKSMKEKLKTTLVQNFGGKIKQRVLWPFKEGHFRSGVKPLRTSHVWQSVTGTWLSSVLSTNDGNVVPQSSSTCASFTSSTSLSNRNST